MFHIPCFLEVNFLSCIFSRPCRRPARRLFDGVHKICRPITAAAGPCRLGFRGTTTTSRQRIGNPVDDVEEQERCWKTLARNLVDTARSPLARFDVDCYCILLSSPSVAADATVQLLHHSHIIIIIIIIIKWRVIVRLLHRCSTKVT